MTSPDTQRLLQDGLAAHRAGNRAAAEQAYRHVLTAAPGQVDASYLLGLLLLQNGDPQAAVDLLQTAATAIPAMAVYQANLALALQSIGDHPRALDALDRALAAEPAMVDAWVMKSVSALALEKWEDAAVACETALRYRPRIPAALVNLGTARRGLGDDAGAEGAFREAVVVAPDRGEPALALARLLQVKARSAEALPFATKAAQLLPQDPEAHYTLGVVTAAAATSRDAIPHYRRALQLRPTYVEALINLGDALRMNGSIEEGLPLTRRAVELAPTNSLLHSALLYAMLFSDDTTSDALLAEHRLWADRHVQPLLDQAPPHPPRAAAGGGRLRIGYVSPDFRDHPIGRYFLPIFQRHSRQQFELVLYSNTRKADRFTEGCRAAADVWRDTTALSDEQLAHLIRADHIDLLIDLSLHMADNRMLAFARKPAPVQIAFSYPGTTGSPALDFRLSDPFLEPPGHPWPTAEKVLQLPHPYSFWCFVPHDDDQIDVGQRPCERNGYLTFGSLNNPAKTSPAAIRQWAAVLARIPTSRLVLLSGTAHDEPMLHKLAAAGIDPRRVSFVLKAPRPQYLRHYQQIDLVLDPFPYTGHCTSNDALWMGVPVLSRVATLPHTRAAQSLMSVLGLPTLIAHNESEFVQQAAELSPAHVSEISKNLRPRMQASPLMDIDGYVKALESLYLQAAVAATGK